MKRLFGALGYRVEVVVLGNWRRCLLDAAAGRVDLVLAYRTPARDRDLAFSAEPVLREDVAIFYNRQRPVRIRSLGDLAGYRGGLLFGESYGRTSTASSAATATSNGFPTADRTSASWCASASTTSPTNAAPARCSPRPGRRREHPCAARTADGGLPAVAVSRHSPLAAKMDEIDRALRGYRDDGSIQRWLDDSVRDYRRLAGNRADAW